MSAVMYTGRIFMPEKLIINMKNLIPVFISTLNVFFTSAPPPPPLHVQRTHVAAVALRVSPTLTQIKKQIHDHAYTHTYIHIHTHTLRLAKMFPNMAEQIIKKEVRIKCMVAQFPCSYHTMALLSKIDKSAMYHTLSWVQPAGMILITDLRYWISKIILKRSKGIFSFKSNFRLKFYIISMLEDIIPSFSFLCFLFLELFKYKENLINLKSDFSQK